MLLSTFEKAGLAKLTAKALTIQKQQKGVGNI